MRPGIAVFVGSLILSSAIATAQQASPAISANSPAAAGAPSSVSSSGILPVFGVNLKADPAWIDGDNFPSKSAGFPNYGTSDSFQKLWVALKPGGFNVLRVEIDTGDTKGAINRVANLCNWAKNNGVTLDLVLGAGPGNDYAAAVTSFFQGLTAAMTQEPGKTAYAQVAFFELGSDRNNPSLFKQTPTTPPDVVLKAATALRQAQTQAASAGFPSRPIIIAASFDWEMVATKSIAGTTFSTDSYKQAYQSLISWLKPITGSGDVDGVSIAWSPGTFTAGGPENFGLLLSSLASDLPGKQLMIRSGFSTAFHSSDEQRQFYMNSFSSLASVRASAGADSKFQGVIFQNGLNDSKPTANADALAGMSKWDWSAKADELAASWRDGKNSPDMTWWLGSVQSGLGLINAAPDTIANGQLPNSGGMDALTQVTQAVASAAGSAPATSAAPPAAAGMASAQDAQGMNAPAAAPATAMGGMPGAQPTPPQGNNFQTQTAMGGMPTTGAAPSQPSGAKGFAAALSQTFQAKTQQGFGNILDIVFQKLGTAVQTAGTGGGSSGRAMMPSGAPPPMGPAFSPQPMMAPDPSAMSNAGMNGMTGMGAPAMPASPPGAGSSGMDMGMSGNPSTMPNAAAMGNSLAATTAPSGMGMNGPYNAAPAMTGGGMPTTPPTVTAPVASATASVGTPPVSPTATGNTTMTAAASPAPNPPAGTPNPPSGGTVSPDAMARRPRGAVQAASINAKHQADAKPLNAPITVAAVQPPSGSSTAAVASAATPASVPNSSATNAVVPTVAPTKTSAPMNATPPPPTSVPGNTTPVASSVVPRGTAATTPSTAQVPVAFAQLGTVTPQGNLVAGVPNVLTVPISNPNAVPFSNIRAMLMVDGRMVQAQTLASLGPNEVHPITFAQVVIPQPGSHEIRIGIQLQRPDSKPQMGVFNQTLLVQPAPMAAPKLPAVTTPNVKPATPVEAAKQVNPNAAASNATSALPKRAELTLSAADIVYAPASPVVGQPLEFRVTVHNLSDVPTRTGVLVLTLFVDGRPVAATQPAIQFGVGPKGTYQATWRAVMPAGTRVEFAGSVSADGEQLSGKGSASILLKSATATPIQPKAAQKHN